MRKLLWFIYPVLALLASGCAVPAAAPGDGASYQREITRIREDQQELARQLQKIQDNLLLMEAKVQDQAKFIQDLRETVAQKVTATGEKAGQTGAGQPLPSIADQPGTRGLSPTEIYLQAFSDYAAGRYPQAILGFESFLKIYPDNDYAGNAQYWLGECYYAQQQYTRAAEEFQKAAELYPNGSKAPDALQKMALSYRQLNQPEKARKTVDILRRRYPESAAARKSLESEETPKQ